MTFLFYDLQGSYEANIEKHPQEYMNEHFKVIHSVNQLRMVGGFVLKILILNYRLF